MNVLRGPLKVVADREVIDHVPCTIQLLRVPRSEASFHELDEFSRLVDAAHKIDLRAHIIVLLVGRIRWVRWLVRRAARLANRWDDGVRVLRHAFCSHLAIGGVPVRATQEPAGHAELMTTQGNMHLSPAVTNEAIERLGAARHGRSRADIVETRRPPSDKLKAANALHGGVDGT
ncbi:MAG: hypothetical protein CL908_09655 [Deltaproteobacteria bacterium]|nr:hypothetical protein [Deltaproteobacteria bacterium]